MTDYKDFLEMKLQRADGSGFAVKKSALSPALYDFQKHITAWTIQKGRAAIFADCGLGKTLMQLVWADAVQRRTKKPVLIITPLAVADQTEREGEKFGIECRKSRDGKVYPITVTNYHRLHLFNAADFAGCVCDESSILKSFGGHYRKEITRFVSKMQYRLLATATAAPNDFIELGTSSEALGYLGYMDMLNRFFRNALNNSSQGRAWGKQIEWRLKGHAELPFWRWVTSWAIALRKPSDLGYKNKKFDLPPLEQEQRLIEGVSSEFSDIFGVRPAANLQEQRVESRKTLQHRCRLAADLVNGTGQPAIVWCHLNDEGDLLKRLIPDAIQVRGSDSYELKEERLIAFANNRERVLITKPKIGAWGLNLQHCAHVVYFPSHSYEQYYQAVRRCWRFGQTRPVHVDLIMTEGQKRVMDNLQRKSEQADKMFDNLIREMNNATGIRHVDGFVKEEEIPVWL